MIAGTISRLSAALLAFCGLALLFAADDILPRHLPGYPPADFWFGQLLAAACLAMATLNWFSRGALLGGIYGRPVVVGNATGDLIAPLTLLKPMLAGPVVGANSTGYLIAAITLLKPMLAGAFRPAGWLLVFPVTALAVAYGWLMLRGPFERDVATMKGADS